LEYHDEKDLLPSFCRPPALRLALLALGLVVVRNLDRE
jgi:hypothetical protein